MKDMSENAKIGYLYFDRNNTWSRYSEWDASISEMPSFDQAECTDLSLSSVAQDQTSRKNNLIEYGNRPVLQVTESNEYTHRFAWGHTEPARHVICLRPPESIDYNLGVLRHEVVHNYMPGERNENHVTERGNGPLYNFIEKTFRLKL